MRAIRGEFGRRRRVAMWTVSVAIAAGGLGFVVWSGLGGSPTPPVASLVTATRGNVTNTVGGVGRITVASASSQIAVGSGSSAGVSPASGGATGANSAPANAVFARSSGHVGRLLVAPNQRVRSGQLLAVVDDDGAAAAALAQAQSDHSSALLEAQADAQAAELDARRAAADLETLRGGAPTARARALVIARRNARLATERLRAAVAPASAADAASARAEVAKAEADLAAIRSAPPSSAQALAVARQAVALAEQRIAALRAGPTPASLSTAEADLRAAEANLSTVQAGTPPATQAELDTATATVATARGALAKLTAPPDPVEMASAQLELDRARGDLAVLTQPPATSPEALVAGVEAVDTARLKLRRVLAGTAAADRTSARLEVQRAESELRALESGPSPAALAAASAAIDASAARAALARAQPRVKAAQALLASAQRAARMLTVRAPTAGTVTALLTAPGAPVDPSTPIATVSDLDHLVAAVDLSEFDVARVRRGLRAIVSVDALGGRRAPGRVRFVALTGNESGGVVSFPVQVAIAQSKGLRTGLNVSVRIILAQRKGVVRVPLEAVSTDANDESSVTIVDGSDRRSTRAVTLGLEDTKNVEIVAGLRAGERVALPVAEGGGP